MSDRRRRDAHPCDRPVRIFPGNQLLQIAMPLGGIGAGCVCLNGYGGIQDFSIRGKPATTAMPDGHRVGEAAFALLHVKADAAGRRDAITRLLEGPLPVEKIYDQGLQTQGYRHGGHEGLPRFRSATFEAAYPFGRVRLADPKVPLDVGLTGFSPFIPNDDINSGIPAAIIEYEFRNTSSEAIEFEFSYHLSHLAGTRDVEKKARNATIPGFGAHLYNVEHPNHESFGGASLGVVGHQPLVKAMWFRGGWFDSISALWREITAGQFKPNDGNVSRELSGHNGASVLVAHRLAPEESMTIPVVITWYFPNRNERMGEAKKSDACCDPSTGCCPPTSAENPPAAWRPFYATQWTDAADVARHVRENYASLRQRTIAFQQAMLSSTLPNEALDAITSNLAILKSPTVLRQASGNIWGWEGCFPELGCCSGTCTHVWNYAQAFPHLFPNLERTIREQELLRNTDPQTGKAAFRAALPDGPAAIWHHAAADGQLGGILKLFRDWKISGDTDWMRRLYPMAKRSLDYCIHQWDPDRRGGLFEPHHNTYDIEFWGPDSLCTSIYTGALAAMAELAKALSRESDAREYGELAKRSAAFLDEELFNGEYHQQKVLYRELRDQSFMQLIAADDASGTGGNVEMLQLLREEGPKYQYGAGCLSDGVIGAWMASFYGIETSVNAERIRATLHAIFTHNFRTDLTEHACTQRPGYAMGHEAGLLLCSWPRGGKPTLPFPYSDEVWTGIEYQVAAHLIAEGMVNEGLTLVRAVRARHEGHVRNPFNEYECGNYYARAMASYALIQALSGFRYSKVERTLWFGPRLAQRPFRTFFSTAGAFGTITLDRHALTIDVIEGELRVETVELTIGGSNRTININLTATPDRAAAINL